MTNEESWIKTDGTDSNLRTWITMDGREHEILVNALQTSQHDLQDELRKLDAEGIDNHLLVLEIDEHETLLQKIHDAPATSIEPLSKEGL